MAAVSGMAHKFSLKIFAFSQGSPGFLHLPFATKTFDLACAIIGVADVCILDCLPAFLSPWVDVLAADGTSGVPRIGELTLVFVLVQQEGTYIKGFKQVFPCNFGDFRIGK